MYLETSKQMVLLRNEDVQRFQWVRKKQTDKGHGVPTGRTAADLSAFHLQQDCRCWGVKSVHKEKWHMWNP